MSTLSTASYTTSQLLLTNVKKAQLPGKWRKPCSSSKPHAETHAHVLLGLDAFQGPLYPWSHWPCQGHPGHSSACCVEFVLLAFTYNGQPGCTLLWPASFASLPAQLSWTVDDERILKLLFPTQTTKDLTFAASNWKPSIELMHVLR